MLESRKIVVQPEAWKDIVSRLPGILNVQFVLEGDAVREVHILSDQSRAPKQIVRDIQSAMNARFQIDLDHRIISVAQIPGNFNVRSVQKKRLLCERLEFSTGRESTSAAVILSLGGTEKRGDTVSILSGSERSRAIAQASVSTINHFLGQSVQVSLTECKRFPMGEKNIIVVDLLLNDKGMTQHLLGACFEGDDPNLAAVLATLDAVNRRILTLEFRTNDRENELK